MRLLNERFLCSCQWSALSTADSPKPFIWLSLPYLKHLQVNSQVVTFRGASIPATWLNWIAWTMWLECTHDCTKLSSQTFLIVKTVEIVVFNMCPKYTGFGQTPLFHGQILQASTAYSGRLASPGRSWYAEWDLELIGWRKIVKRYGDGYFQIWWTVDLSVHPSSVGFGKGVILGY